MAAVMENPRYQCDVWSDGFLTAVESNASTSVFFIKIYAQIRGAESLHYGQIMLPQSHVTEDKTVWSAICVKLMEMDVPVNLHAPVIQKVVECARAMESEIGNAGSIVVWVRLIREPGEGLETVRCGGETCAVCLEGMSEGLMLPCNHVFHGSCIRRWLRRKNLCPLCRFQIMSS